MKTSIEAHHATVPVGVVNMVLDKHTIVAIRGDHKPLNVGTMLYMAKIKVPFGRVVGYYFGSVTKPDYVVRLDSDMYKRFQGIPVTFFRKSAQHIDEEDLYKRFHDPIKNEFDLFETDISHVPKLHYQHFKSTQSTEDNFNQPFHMHYQPMMYHIPETPMMYQPVPNLVPSLAPMMPMMPMMRNKQHNFRSNQITEQNRGAQESTLFACQSYFNQPFGMQQQPSLNVQAPMMYNQHQQFMRHETNHQNPMGTIPNLVQKQAPMMYNQQQRFGVDVNYSNQQHFGLPEMNFNPPNAAHNAVPSVLR